MGDADEKEKVAWNTTEESAEILKTVNQHRIILLHGSPLTGKSTLIGGLGFPVKEEQTLVSDNKRYLNLGRIAGIASQKQEVLKNAIKDCQNKNCQLVIESKTYDLVNLLCAETQDGDSKQEATEIDERAKIISGKLKEWKELVPEIRLLSLSPSDADKLLTHYIASLPKGELKSALDRLEEKETKEIRGTVLKYCRISKDDVPELKTPKGRGYYFFEDLKQAIHEISPDERTIDKQGYEGLKKKVEQHKVAEKMLLSTPVVFPFLEFASLGSPVTSAAGALPQYLSLFSSFIKDQRPLFSSILTAIIPQIPAFGVSLALLYFLRRKENKKDDFNKTLLELAKFWGGLTHSKRIAIGEIYDSVLGSERGRTKKIFDGISGIPIDELQSKLNQLQNQIARLETSVSELRADMVSLRQESETSKGYLTSPEDIGLTFDEEWYLTDRITGDVRVKLVKSSAFQSAAERIRESVTKGGIVIIKGARGVGKSVLTRYVLANVLHSGDIQFVLNLSDAMKKQSMEIIFNELFQKKGCVVLYDPLVPEVYGAVRSKYPNTLPSEVKDEIARTTTLLDWLRVYGDKNGPSIVVLPNDLYDLIQPYVSDIVIEQIDLSDRDFLKSIVVEYAGCMSVPDELISKIQSYNGGNTLIAMLTGRLLKESDGRKKIDEVIQASERSSELFIEYYIWKGLLGSDENKALKFALPLLLHFSFLEGACPVSSAYIYVQSRQLSSDLSTSLPRLRLSPLDSEVSNWISRYHEDLIEIALKHLVVESVNGKTITGGLSLFILSIRRVIKELMPEGVDESDGGAYQRIQQVILVIWKHVQLYLAEKFSRLSDRCLDEVLLSYAAAVVMADIDEFELFTDPVSCDPVREMLFEENKLPLASYFILLGQPGYTPPLPKLIPIQRFRGYGTSLQDFFKRQSSDLLSNSKAVTALSLAAGVVFAQSNDKREIADAFRGTAISISHFPRSWWMIQGCVGMALKELKTPDTEADRTVTQIEESYYDDELWKARNQFFPDYNFFKLWV